MKVVKRGEESDAQEDRREADSHETALHFADSWNLAKLREVTNIIINGVLGPEVEDPVHPMTCGWKLTEKTDPVTGRQKKKARLFIRGCQAPATGETFAGTPSFADLLVSLLFALSCVPEGVKANGEQRWSVVVVDVKHAFLLANAGDDRQMLRITGNMPDVPDRCPFPDLSQVEWDVIKIRIGELQPGRCFVLRKALYGLKQAPFWWGEKLRAILGDLGFREIRESVYVRMNAAEETDAILVVHVDDLKIMAYDPSPIVSGLKGALKLNDALTLTKGAPVTFTGVDFEISEKGLEVTQNTYCKTLRVPALRPRKRVVDSDDLSPPLVHETIDTLVPVYRRIVGILGWTAKTRPDIGAAVAVLGRFCATPTRRHLAAAERVLHYVLTTNRPLLLVPIEGNPQLSAYSDGGFKRKQRAGRAGFKIFLHGEGMTESPGRGENLIAWVTRRLKTVGSSTAAELMALELVVKRLWGFISLLWKLWRVHCKVTIYIDSRPLYQQLRTGQCNEEPVLEGILDYCITHCRAMNAKVEWIMRTQQLADELTKPDIIQP
eukprot:GHVU01085240.1.p1 GENE.GHVU01085240.1~~GHVU01085240.1.p1  ORF type:complete len:550 (-),score=40.12 GHVU01085240.1:623-2272(-)